MRNDTYKMLAMICFFFSGMLREKEIVAGLIIGLVGVLFQFVLSPKNK